MKPSAVGAMAMIFKRERQWTRIPPKWVWLKIKPEGLRRFWSMFPLARVPFWYRLLEPQPNDVHQRF